MKPGLQYSKFESKTQNFSFYLYFIYAFFLIQMHQPVKLRDHLPASMDQSYSSQTEIRADNMHYGNCLSSLPWLEGTYLSFCSIIFTSHSSDLK